MFGISAIISSRMRIIISGLFLTMVMALAPGLSSAQGPDEVGIYFDTDYLTNSIEVTGFPGFVTGYLVLHDPSAAGGIGGWELCAAIDGAAQFTSWTIEGQHINTDTPPCFTVGIGGPPLPWAPDVLLATFQMVVEGPLPIALKLKPQFFASIPGSMAYVDGADPEILIPMATTTGNQEVAWINNDLPWYEVQPSVLTFADVLIGTSVFRTLRVENIGGGILNLDVALPDSCPEFALTGFSGQIGLAAGEAILIEVTFNPITAGQSSCLLQLGDLPPPYVLFGIGRDPIIDWWVSPAQIDFGEVVLLLGENRDVLIKNLSEIPLTFTPLIADQNSAFSIVAGGGQAIIGPGAVRRVEISFIPDALGPFADFLDLGSILPDVPLTGIGRARSVAYVLDPERFSFLPLFIGQTLTDTFTLLNTGESDLALDPQFALGEPSFSIVSGSGPSVLVPGQLHEVSVQYQPTVLGAFADSLVFGPAVDPVPISATAVEPFFGCNVSPLVMNFGPIMVGQTETKYLTVINTGTLPLTITPASDSNQFHVDTTGFILAPGQQELVLVDFRPQTEGPFTSSITLVPGSCDPVACTGITVPPPPPGVNEAGVYFDPAYLFNRTHTSLAQEVVSGYFVLKNPSQISGVGGWEACLEIQGDATWVSEDIQGQYLNLETPPCFLVGIGGEPLPYSPAVLLATFELRVANPWSEITILIGPIRHASIPGFSAYTPWDNPELLVPMQPAPGGSIIVASINESALAVQAPSPSVTLAGSFVELEWPAPDNHEDLCHVYRRETGNQAVRLTSEPLLASGPRVTWRDAAAGFAPGTKLYYSYSLVRDGQELARSPEVEITVSGIPLATSRLLSNVPNPFNPMTTVHFELAETGPTRITIYDLTGRLIRTLVNETLAAGPQQRIWQGRDDAGRTVPSGAYYLRLDTGDKVDHRKVMLLK